MSETQKNTPLDWNNLDAMSDQGLATLVDSAIFVLHRSDAADTPSPTELPNSVLMKQLEQALTKRGVDGAVAGNLVTQQGLSRPVAVAVLGAIATEPVLAQEVERVWQERGGLLFVGAETILGAALLLLVLKLKKVKVSKQTGTEIEFDKVSSGALGAILKFVGG